DVPLHARAELREMNFGEWEGMALAEIRERFPEALERRQDDLVHYSPPGDGESVGEMAERVTACFEDILEEEEGRDILLVGHGGVNRVILCDALGLDLGRMFSIQQDYGCLNIVDYFPDSTLVRLMNG
ncbi:MAG: histidine phosphatase family protein, partial [Deltaproteobacteria bacterium]|nr:histidine phosphatase family protein [Deltaproteobacteria bacterium]